MTCSTHRFLSFLLALEIATQFVTPVWAQIQADPKSGPITLTGGIDFRNAYMFRGIQQDDTGVVVWPHAELGWVPYAGDGALKRMSVTVGTWNSVHSGVAGLAGPSDKAWYESDVSASLGLRFGQSFNIAGAYTAYVSPNEMFTSVKELSLKFSIDDRLALGRVGLAPYGLVAFELDTEPGIGQIDGGFHAGKYLELGTAPGYSGNRASVAFPFKVGLSLGNYYELAGKDNRFGFASVAGIVTLPIGAKGTFGGWNMHGGVEYQALGKTTKAFNGDDGSKTIGSIGIGFSY